MLNKEKYNYGQKVRFIFDGEVKEGVIVVVEPYGSYWPDTASYDIQVPSESGAWYKHVFEKDVIGVL